MVINKQKQTRKSRALVAFEFIEMINRQIFSRNVILSGGLDELSDSHIDASTSVVSTPDFLNKIVKSPFFDRPEALANDLTYHIYLADSTAGGISSINESFYRSFRDECVAIIDMGQSLFCDDNISYVSQKINSMSECITMFRSMVAATSLSELRKGQVLVGSPTLHTPVSKAGHPVYNEIPEGFFNYDWTSSEHLGTIVRQALKIERAKKFTLPLTTSQGLLLKGISETVEQRVRSKALLSAIALKCSTMTELKLALSFIGGSFAEKGFYNIGSAFYVGMRKQAARKPEPIQDQEGEIISVSNALQGRIRGIFPAPEAIKVFLKPLSDGVKKALFERSEGFSVDARIIARDSAICGALTLALGLFRAESEDLRPDGDRISSLSQTIGMPLTFYDLSAFDTTQHAGLNDLGYIQFLKGVFPDLESREEDLCSVADLLFPESVLSEQLLIQSVNGWSTMSGQPDVTIKNNIIHLLVMVKAIHKSITIGRGNESSFFYKSDEISEERILNAILYQNDFIVSKVHGDDTILCFSPSPVDQDTYLLALEETGLRYGLEYGFSYLKKIPSEDLIEEGIKVISEVDDIRTLSMTQWVDLLNKMRSIVGTKLASVNVSEIFNSPRAFMHPVMGSLMKNRFGEYPNEFVGSFLIGMIDVITLALPVANSASFLASLHSELMRLSELLVNIDDGSAVTLSLKFRLQNNGEEKYLGEYLVAVQQLIEIMDELITYKGSDVIRKFSKSDEKFSRLLSVKNALASLFGELMISRMDQANSLRDHLTRMFYTSFQDESLAFGDNDVFADLYGMLSYDPTEEAKTYGYLEKDLSELIGIGYDLQKQLIVNNGFWSVD